MEVSCPQCHVAVRETDYYCYNCGKNLKQKPLSTSLTTEILCYVGSLALPPLGAIWGVRYLRQTDPVSKRIGVVSIGLTIVAVVIGTIWAVNLMQTVQSQVNQQMNVLQGF